MNTVTISLERYKELEQFEQAVLQRKTISYSVHNCYKQLWIVEENESLFKELNEENLSLSNQLFELNKEKTIEEFNGRFDKNIQPKKPFWKKLFS